MAAHSSLSQELIKAINMPNIRPTPAYLSEEDAITMDMFMQSEYTSDYMIDTRNIHWGGEVHHSHIFNIYAKFSPTRDDQLKLDTLCFLCYECLYYHIHEQVLNLLETSQISL